MPIYTTNRGFALETADINGDGVPDILTKGNGVRAFSVFLGNGNGTFRAMPDLTFDNGSLRDFGFGDFDRDGKTDLVAVDDSFHVLRLWRGNGDGSFAAPAAFAVPTGSRYLMVEDFNRDGKTDVAIAGGSSSRMLFGKGDGTFQPAVDFRSPGNPMSAAIAADLNGDNWLDVIFAGSFRSVGQQQTVATVAVLLNDGHGGFPGFPIQYDIGPPLEDSTIAFDVAAADLNGDGKVDLLAEVRARSTVSVLLGNGDGTLGAWTEYPAGQIPFFFKVADLDLNGTLDLVLANGNQTNFISIVPGNGDGSFSPGRNIVTGSSPSDVVVGDFNGDGRPDLAVTNQISSTLGVLLSRDGHLAPYLGIAQFGAAAAGGGWTSDDSYPRRFGDVNGDGRADAIGFGEHGVYVALATSDGHFGGLDLVSGQFGASAAAGGWSDNDRVPRALADVNGDGLVDIIGFGEHGVYVALATGGGHFGGLDLALGRFGAGADAGGWTSDNLYPREVGDVNGDGRADLVGFGETGVYLALGQADGTFAEAYAERQIFAHDPNSGGLTSSDIYPRAVADVNGDGLADLIAAGDNGLFVAQAGIDFYF